MKASDKCFCRICYQWPDGWNFHSTRKWKLNCDWYLTWGQYQATLISSRSHSRGETVLLILNLTDGYPDPRVLVASWWLLSMHNCTGPVQINRNRSHQTFQNELAEKVFFFFLSWETLCSAQPVRLHKLARPEIQLRSFKSRTAENFRSAHVSTFIQTQARTHAHTHAHTRLECTRLFSFPHLGATGNDLMHLKLFTLVILQYWRSIDLAHYSEYTTQCTWSGWDCGEWMAMWREAFFGFFALYFLFPRTHNFISLTVCFFCVCVMWCNHRLSGSLGRRVTIWAELTFDLSDFRCLLLYRVKNQ